MKNKMDEVLRIARRHDKSKNASLLELVNWIEFFDLSS